MERRQQRLLEAGELYKPRFGWADVRRPVRMRLSRSASQPVTDKLEELTRRCNATPADAAAYITPFIRIYKVPLALILTQHTCRHIKFTSYAQ